MSRGASAEYTRETQRAAQRLGLATYGPDADVAIVEYCRQQVERFAASYGLPPTTGEMLEMVATCLDVEFVEIHSEEDLASLLRRIPPQVDPALARVKAELDNDADAITIRRRSPGQWERRYLAVVNCRAWHYPRRFFTKWHELGHRLLDGEQLMFACRRTPTGQKDPGEVLVDKIAGALAFYPGIVGPSAEASIGVSGLTFESVDALRHRVAHEASRQAAALALLSYVDRPAWYLRCAVALKLSETRIKPLADSRPVVPKLRVKEAYPNERATQLGPRIHQWMRVPESSLVSLAWHTGVDQTGEEHLEIWETSTSGPIGYGLLSIDTWVVRDEVFVLASTDGDPQIRPRPTLAAEKRR